VPLSRSLLEMCCGPKGLSSGRGLFGQKATRENMSTGAQLYDRWGHLPFELFRSSFCVRSTAIARATPDYLARGFRISSLNKSQPTRYSAPAPQIVQSKNVITTPRPESTVQHLRSAQRRGPPRIESIFSFLPTPARLTQLMVESNNPFYSAVRRRSGKDDRACKCARCTTRSHAGSLQLSHRLPKRICVRRLS
jgi:hypothetical protein